MGRYKSRSLRKIVKSEINDDLYLPVFQRGFKWARRKQKKLLASFLVDIPIGAILLLEGKGGEFAKRKLCYRENNRMQESNPCEYLLDGQQRVSTLKSIFYDFYKEHEEWVDSEWRNMYPPLRNRWFLNLSPEEEHGDIFGLSDLHFKEDSIFNIDSEEVLPYIENKRIQLNQKSRWFNPGYPREEIPHKDKNQVQQDVAESAANNWMLPLYSLTTEYETSNTVHELSVERIAYRRKKQIQAEVEDGEKNIVDILEPIEGSIEDYVENDNNEKIDVAWNRLETRWTRRVINYLESVLDNQIPTIELKENEVDRAVSIFDNMNQGGTPLSTFDLVAARAAKNRPLEESLIDQIISTLEQPIDLPSSLTSSLVDLPEEWNPSLMDMLDADDPPSKTARKYILNILSILHYSDTLDGGVNGLESVHAKKRKQLEMSSSEINGNLERCISTFSRAMAFLQFRCGIKTIGDVSYDLMLIPISLAVSKDDIWGSEESVDKIEYWYWSSIFSGHYREKQNTRSMDDAELLLEWIEGDIENPFSSRADNMFEANVYTDDQMLLRELPEPEQYPVPSAVSDTILQYVLSLQPKDFLPSDQFESIPRLSAWSFALGDTFQDVQGQEYSLRPEDHHICPVSGATSLSQSADEIRGDQKSVLNSPVLKTTVSRTANRIIGDMSEDQYVDYLDDISPSSHLLPNTSELGEREDETTEEYYFRAAMHRLENIKNSVRDELDRLNQ